MRLVHLSDLHLGYRQYQRLTPGGINQREADVAGTFRHAIDAVIALRPDVVVIAGDVFHTVRPPNQAILHAFLQFTRLVQSLPGADVVLIAGNHDTPRSTEAGGILQLFAQLDRIHVVDKETKRLAFARHDLSILAVPDVPGLDEPSFTPDPDARYNVLAIHGEVQGMLPEYLANVDRAAVQIPLGRLHAPLWSYVAFGHYHVCRQIAPNAFYSGSIDYTSANSWGERFEESVAGLPGKGFIERDLATGTHRFHPLAASRPLIDLPPINARGLTASDIDERMRATIETWPGGIDDRIVRLIVRDIPRHIARELDHKAIRDYKRRALNFQLDTRRPELQRASASGSPGRHPSLPEVVREKLEARALDADIDRKDFVDRGVAYLVEAETTIVAPASIVDG